MHAYLCKNRKSPSFVLISFSPIVKLAIFSEFPLLLEEIIKSSWFLVRVLAKPHWRLGASCSSKDESVAILRLWVQI